MNSSENIRTSNLEASQHYGWRTDIDESLLTDPFYVADMKAHMSEGMTEEQARAEIVMARAEGPPRGL
jgi:hypothetical protein